MTPQHQRGGRPLIHLRAVADGVLRVKISGPVRQREVAPQRKRIAERGDDLAWVRIVRERLDLPADAAPLRCQCVQRAGPPVL